MCTANQISNWEVLLRKFQWSIFHSKFNWHLSSGEGAKGKNWLVIVYLQRVLWSNNFLIIIKYWTFLNPTYHPSCFLYLTDNRVALLEHFTTWYPTQGVLQNLLLALYLWIPWNVLLAISTMPPVGRATTPTSPFPIPLKNPAAPSFLAPLKERKQKNKCFHDLLEDINNRIKPLLLQGNCFVLETAHSHWLQSPAVQRAVCGKSPTASWSAQTRHCSLNTSPASEGARTKMSSRFSFSHFQSGL